VKHAFFAITLLPALAVALPRPAGMTVAEGTAAVLGAAPEGTLDLSMSFIRTDGEVIDAPALGDGLTLVFYFSPTCPHCQVVAPEIAALKTRFSAELTVLGIGSGSGSLADLRKFADAYKLDMTLLKDFSRQFAAKNEADSTPQVFVVRRGEGPAAELLAAWRPFPAGHGLVAEMRILSLLGRDPWQAFRAGEYHGSKACAECHTVEHRAWGLSFHSIAYWTLYDRGVAEDGKCVGCHVTGFGQPGGFKLADHGSALAEVGCEACHGASGPHVPGARAEAAAATALCAGCHDAEHSVRFSVERALPHIDHWRADALDPTAFAKARAALVDGTAERPLTAFPDGKNLGDDACFACHKQLRKHAAGDPHAGSRALLERDGKGADPACLVCHALPTEKGGASFHPGDVGCESCHGPGEQHVAAGGGKENIVGLGESCPVCVIDAICTRCHTPEWDPDWNLDARLSALRAHGRQARAK
jgi:peroxiredoxin